MKPTRLFQTIVVVGASLTGGMILPATMAVLAGGCNDDSATRQSWPDIGVPHDMAKIIDQSWHDIGVPRDMSKIPDGGADAQ